MKHRKIHQVFFFCLSVLLLVNCRLTTKVSVIKEKSEHLEEHVQLDEFSNFFYAGYDQGDDNGSPNIVGELDPDPKQKRINIEWNVDDLLSISDDIEVFVFKYYVSKVNNNGSIQYVEWVEEVSPDAGKFITNCGDLQSNTVYSFRVYVRYKDHIGPKQGSSSNTKYIDPNEEDSSLWFLNTITVKTIKYPGSNIIGFYGYDARENSAEICPEGLVYGWILDINKLLIDDPTAIKVRLLNETSIDQSNYIGSDLTEFSLSVAESRKWDLSCISGSNEFINDSISKLAQNGSNAYENGLKKYIGDKDQIDYLGMSKFEKTLLENTNVQSGSSGVMGMIIEAIASVVGSTMNSVLGLFKGEESYSSESEKRDYSQTIIGHYKYQRNVQEEYLSTKYLSVPVLKNYLSYRFKSDINNPDVTPEELFDMYGTHVILDLIIGGKMTVDWTCDNTQNYSSSDVKQASFSFTSGTSSGSSSTSDYINENSKLVTSVWGGLGAVAAVKTLSEYTNVTSTWSDTIYNKSTKTNNTVFVDAPDMFAKQMSLSGIWNYADTEKRQREILNAYMRYVIDSAYELNSKINKSDIYLSDIHFGTLKNRKSSLSYVLDQMSEELILNEDKEFNFIKIMSDGVKPLEFGNYYGAGLYTFDKDTALKGIAVTHVDGKDDFLSHAQELIVKYDLIDAIVDEEKKMVNSWHFCEMDGDVRFWKSWNESVIKESNPQALMDCSLFVKSGSSEDGWKNISDNIGNSVFVKNIELSVKRNTKLF